jgi:DNA repair exonuclease SbcCD nuclease subunit
MVRVIAIGDLHLKATTPSKSDLVLSRLTEKIVGLKPDIVVLLGDILDTHEKIDMLTQNKAVAFIKHLASMKTGAGESLQVIVIIGNHDRPNSTEFLTDNSCFFSLKRIMPNLHIADHVLSLSWAVPGIKDTMRFVFVPFVLPGKFHQALDTLREKVMDPAHRPYTIFCHQEFKGVSMGRTKSKIGDEWPEENPLIITGHIHTFQQTQPNIICAGTPYQMSRSDDSPKGIIVADYAFGKVPDIKLVELGIQKMVTLTLKPSEVDSFIPPENCEVQVDIRGTPEEIKALNKSNIASKLRARGISVSLSPVPEKVSINPDNKPLKTIIIEMISNNPELLKVYNKIFSTQPMQGQLDQTAFSNMLKSAQNFGAVKTVDTKSLLDALTPVRAGYTPQSAIPVVPVQISMDGTKNMFAGLLPPQPQTIQLQPPMQQSSPLYTQTEKGFMNNAIQAPIHPPNSQAVNQIQPPIPAVQPVQIPQVSLMNLFNPTPVQTQVAPSTPTALRLPGNPFNLPSNNEGSSVLNFSVKTEPEKKLSNSDLLLELQRSAHDEVNKVTPSLLTMLEQAKK